MAQPCTYSFQDALDSAADDLNLEVSALAAWLLGARSPHDIQWIRVAQRLDSEGWHKLCRDMLAPQPAQTALGQRVLQRLRTRLGSQITALAAETLGACPGEADRDLALLRLERIANSPIDLGEEILRGPVEPESLDDVVSPWAYAGGRAGIDLGAAYGPRPRQTPRPRQDPPEMPRHLTRHEALELLNLPPSAGKDTIHAAYRRLAREHHPDRFAHQGPQAVQTATRRFLLLRAAHDLLMAAA